MSFEEFNSVPLSSSKSSMEKRGEERKKPFKEVKYELVSYDSLPEYLKDNEFILHHYRCNWPMKETILSIFSVHNETLNIWTHLIGFVFFLSLTAAVMIRTASSFAEISFLPSHPSEAKLQRSTSPTSADWQLTTGCVSNRLTKNHSLAANCSSLCLLDRATPTTSPRPVTRWPFLAFLGGAMVCLLSSSLCHLLACHSEHTAGAMLRLDYAGISALIVTSFYPVAYYSFACRAAFQILYICLITAFGAAVVAITSVPVFQKPAFRSVRAALFFCMALSGAVPVVHKLAVFGDRPEAVLSAGYELMMGGFYGIGALVYALRVPERWLPGRFDLLGHSHQYFHVLVVAGAYSHYLAVLVYLRWRDSEACN